MDKCQYKKTQCNFCFNYVLLSYFDQHKKEECPEREINCDYCNARVIAKNLKVLLTIYILVYFHLNYCVDV